MTNQRLVFRPHGFDRALAGREFSAPLSSIQNLDEAPVNMGHLFGGGLRKRLRVTLADGTQELFVVNKRPELMEEIRRAAGGGQAFAQPPPG